MLANGHHGLEMNKIWQCSVVGVILLSWVKAAECLDKHVCASQRATKANGQDMSLGICLICSSLSHLTHSSTGSCVLNTSWRRACKIPLKSALVLMPNTSKSVCLGCQPFWCGSGAERNTTAAPAKHYILLTKWLWFLDLVPHLSFTLPKQIKPPREDGFTLALSLKGKANCNHSDLQNPRRLTQQCIQIL